MDAFARIVSVAAHVPFEVTATRRRSGGDETIRCVLHLDAQEWSPAMGADGLAREDLISVRAEYELARGDEIILDDASSWTITGREPVNTDGYVTLWRMRRSRGDS